MLLKVVHSKSLQQMVTVTLYIFPEEAMLLKQEQDILSGEVKVRSPNNVLLAVVNWEGLDNMKKI